MSEIAFDLRLPCSDAELRANVRKALSRGLPETQARKSLAIVANGPSAKAAPFGAFGMPTLAVNGALRQFTERGMAPTYWAACDPQALVADFLKDAPEETVYLVASKCHPAVFDALRGRKVMVWHVADTEIPGRVRAPLCCSVTMSAAWEMRQAFGFTDQHFYGWDGSFMDGEHHAGDPAGDYHSQRDYVSVGIGERDFDTTHSWAAEAGFAGQFFQLADYFDISLTIHGQGMISAARDALRAA